MNKGLSAWLFSKMVMLAFLLIVFGIMGGFLTILNERAFNDSASIFCLQAKEYTSGVANSNIISMQRILPIPKVLPSETSQQKRMYYLVVNYYSNSKSISFAITHDMYHKNVYVASSLLYLPDNIDVNMDGRDFKIGSDEYRYLVIQKEQNKLSIYACKEIGTSQLIGCMEGI